MATSNLTPERLRELLDYDPLTGIFTWRVNQGGTAWIGTAAGTNQHGYVRINVDRSLYYAHRLAWFYVYGTWPKLQIDHKDGNRANNCIDNLRDVSKNVNMQNALRVNPRNTSGLMGVWKTKHGFSSMICVNKKRIFLGVFATAEEAHTAYIEAKKIYHPGFISVP